MVREVVTLNVGGAGVRVGSTVWRQYCAEHNIDESGNKHSSKSDTNINFKTVFEEQSPDQYVARNVSIDLENDSIDCIRNSSHRTLFQSECLLSFNESSGGTFARANCFVFLHIPVAMDKYDCE